MKKPKFQSPTGMHDILPEQDVYFQKIYETARQISEFYGFGRVETPILEESELFLRGLGLTTDIVEKQMFTFRTKGDDFLTLRPEGTTPIVRSYIEHGFYNLPQPVKIWYWGPYFRYEKPQAGRYRQFWQFGLEVFGEKSPAVDAQVIQIFYNFLQDLKIDKLVVEINSIGDNNCRPYYKKTLNSYLKSRTSALCSDCKRRLKENPLRILDCKEERCQQVRNQAPQILDYLCQECHNHLKELLECLDEINIPYHLNPYLVRGLDYYTRTVFEIFGTEEELKNLGAIVGGGRYDLLVKMMGGKEVPAVGGAAGLERIIKIMEIKGIQIRKKAEPKVYLAQLGTLAKRKSLKLLEDFRKSKIPVAESIGRDSLKVQLARADRLKSRYTLILGQKEVLEGTIVIRDMTSGVQETIKIEKLIKEIQKKLKK